MFSTGNPQGAPHRVTSRRSSASMRPKARIVGWSQPSRCSSPCASKRASRVAGRWPRARACRAHVSSDTTMSPRTGAPAGALGRRPAAPAGNARTSVGRSIDRCLRFSARTAASFVIKTETAHAPAPAARAMAATRRRRAAFRGRRRRPPIRASRTSTCTFSRRRGGRALRPVGETSTNRVTLPRRSVPPRSRPAEEAASRRRRAAARTRRSGRCRAPGTNGSVPAGRPGA